MNGRTSRIIFGGALSVAAIAIAIDHTKHPLPEPAPVEQPVQSNGQNGPAFTDGQSDEAPCAIDTAPCAMGEAPCSMD